MGCPQKGAQGEAMDPVKWNSFEMQCVSSENSYEMCVVEKCEMF